MVVKLGYPLNGGCPLLVVKMVEGAYRHVGGSRRRVRGSYSSIHLPWKTQAHVNMINDLEFVSLLNNFHFWYDLLSYCRAVQCSMSQKGIASLFVVD